MVNRFRFSEIKFVGGLFCMLLGIASNSAAQQEEIPRSGIPYNKVFVPSNDLGSFGLDNFSPIEVKRLEDLLQKYSESHPTEAVGAMDSDSQDRPQLNSAYYVAKLVGADLLSERSRLTFAGSSQPSQRVTLRPWSLAIQPIESVSAASEPQSTPSLIFDEQGAPQAALMSADHDGSKVRIARQREFLTRFGWSARAESGSSPNKLKFSFEIPKCANSCLVLALPPQAVVQDCLTSARRVDEWTDIELRLVGWDDFGKENIREQSPSRTGESLWLIELGGSQVVSFSIALGVGIRPQDDASESEVHRFRQLIRSQNLEHFVEGQEIRTTCEAVVNLSLGPSPMRMSLSPTARLRRLFVDQQEVDWKVDSDWIHWNTASVSPGTTPLDSVSVLAEIISPLSMEGKEKLEMPIVSFDRGYVMSGTTVVHSTSPWRLTSVDCGTSRIVEPTAEPKASGVNRLEFSWYANPPSISVALERIVPVRRCELLTRLTNDERGTSALIRAKLFFAEKDSSQAKILIAPGWTVRSITSTYPSDTLVVQPDMDSFANSRELRLSWKGVQKNRVGEVEIQLLHNAVDNTSNRRRVEHAPIVEWPSWKQYDTIAVDESSTFELQIRDSLLDDLVSSDSIPDWQRSLLPRTNMSYLFRMESQPTDRPPDNRVTESDVQTPASHLTGFVWLEKPIRNQAKLRTEISRISPTRIQAKHEIQISFGSSRNEPFSIELASENTFWRLKKENKWTPLHPLDSASALNKEGKRVWRFDLRQTRSECTLLAVVNADISDDHEILFPVPTLPNAEMLVQEARSITTDVSIHCSDESSTWTIDDAGHKFLNFTAVESRVVLIANVTAKNPSRKWLINKNELHIAVDAFGCQKGSILSWSGSPPRNSLAIELDYGWEPLSVTVLRPSMSHEIPFRMDGRRLLIAPILLAGAEHEGFQIQIDLAGPRLMKEFSLESLSENFRFKWPDLLADANCLRQERFLWLPVDMQIADLDNPSPLREKESWPIWRWSRQVVASLFGFVPAPTHELSISSSRPWSNLVPLWAANGWRIALAMSNTDESSRTSESRAVIRISKVDAVRSYIALFFAFIALITPRLILFRHHLAAFVAALFIVCAHASSIGITRFANTGLVAMCVSFISFMIYWLLYRPGIVEKGGSQRNSERWSPWNERKGDVESESQANHKMAMPVPAGGNSITSLRSLGIFLVFGLGVTFASSPYASVAMGQEESDTQTPAYQIVIPTDDAGNMAGTKAYVQNELLDTLNGNSDRVRSADRGTHPISAKYSMRVGKQTRGFGFPDQLNMRYDFWVGEDLTPVRFPMNGSQLQLQRFSIDGFEVNLSKLRSPGLEWIWTPEKPGRHSVQIVSQPVLKTNETDRSRESSIQLLDIAVLPIANATIDIDTDKQNTIEVVSLGRVTNPEAGRFSAMLGAVDRLQVRVIAPIARLGGASTLPTNASDSGTVPFMNTELFLQNDILQAKTIVDFPKGITVAREVEFEADLQWLPVGFQWGDAELVELRPGTTLSRRRYVLEWKKDSNFSNAGSISTRDLQISVVWVPQSSSQSLNVLFAECLDRRTRRGTLRYSQAQFANWSIEGIGTWNVVIDAKNRLDWPELKVKPYATTLSIPPNGEGILKPKTNSDRQQARVTTKWVIEKNHEFLTSRIELRGGSSTFETLFVELPDDFLVTELYHRNRNEPIPFLQKKSNGKLQLQILAERRLLDELLIQAKKQTVEDSVGSVQREWQAFPWIELPNSINSDQTMEVLASEFVAIRLEAEPTLFFGKETNVSVLNLAKSFSDIHSNALASTHYQLIRRDSPLVGKLTVKQNLNSKEIEALGEFSSTVSSRPNFVIEVPASLRDRWQSESRINAIPCPESDKAWLQVHLPEPTSLEGDTQLSTLVRFTPRSDEPISNSELTNRIHSLDRDLIPTHRIELSGNIEAGEISARIPKTGESSKGLSVSKCILQVRNINLLASPSSQVLLESQYWMNEVKGSHSAIGNLEWQLGDDVEILSIMVNGSPVDYDQDGRRIRCLLAQAGLCADVILFTKHSSSNKTSSELIIDAPQLLGHQTVSDIVLIDDPRIAVKLSGQQLLPTAKLKAIRAIAESCLGILENAELNLSISSRIDQGSDLARWLKYWRQKAYRYLEEWTKVNSTSEQSAFGMAVQRWHALETPEGFAIDTESIDHRMESNGSKLDQADKLSEGINWYSLLGCFLILMSITLLAPSFGVVLCERPWWYFLAIGFFVWIVFGTILPVLVLGFLGLIVAADTYWILTSRLRRSGTRGLR